MSPDRLTITRAEAIRIRREEEQKRREKLIQKTVSKPKPAPAPKPRRKAERAAPFSATPGSTTRLRHRYDIAMSLPYGRAETFNSPKEAARVSIPIPHIGFGPRWFSFLIAALCATGMYYMLSMDPFIVHGADIQGNNRVNTQDIANVLGVVNQPAALLNPAQIEYNILATFPDIAFVQIDVNLPADVAITVFERQPVTAWLQDGQLVWVDAQGYAFPPRGQVDGLVTVTATGAPPIPANVNVAQGFGAHPFLTTDLAAAIITLSPHVPQGAALVYDPRYGLGWNDPHGWKAYFGHSNGNTALKLAVYQSMLDYLTKQSIQPKLISVEYPNAPFYRVEQ